MPQFAIAERPAPPLKNQFLYATLGLNVVSDVRQIMTLVNENLSEDTKHFLKPQSLENLQDHINNGFPILGAVDLQTGKLAAILLITPTKNLSLCKNLDGYPLLDKPNTAVIQCVAVHPDFGKRGLMTEMLAKAEIIATNMGIQHLVAKIATEGDGWEGNEKSEKGFGNAGFKAEVEGHDVKLNYPVRYWLKSQLQQVANTNYPVFNGTNADGSFNTTYQNVQEKISNERRSSHLLTFSLGPRGQF